MKLSVGAVVCEQSVQSGTLDSTLVKIMSCESSANGSASYYAEKDGSYVYTKPIDEAPAPPPSSFPEDSPAVSMQTVAPVLEQQPTQNKTFGEALQSIPPIYLLGGGLLLWFLIAGKKKKRK